MKNLTRIFLIISLFLTTVHLSNGQAADSSMVKKKGTDNSGVTARGNGNAYGRSSATGQNSQGQKVIKQIHGARPDMSKARGARPPQIERPSGSGIPRGMGKPGGAGKRPGR